MKRLLLVIALAFCCPEISADTLYVPSGQYSTIQSAIDDSNDSDTIIVSAGTYLENIDFLGKAVILQSEDPNDPGVVATTIIDGSNPADPNIGSVVTFKEGENANSVLTGFTIQNGTGQTDPTVTWRGWDGENGDGGGVLCSNASPTITKNIFKNCLAEYGGGGIFCHNGASPVITHNTFIDNYAGWYGGGVFARANCSPTISGNIFKNNTAHYIGGAIYLGGQCHSTITNNWFEKNDSERLHGGAIYYFVNCSPIIACNFFIGNTCSGPANNNPTGSAILLEATTAGKVINNLFTGNTVINTHIRAATITSGSSSTDLIANNIIYDNNNVGIYTWQAGTVIKNNDVWANAAGNYGGVTGDLTGTNGNISADPQVMPAFPEPLTLHELHPNSPCIDAGANDALEVWLTEDYDGTSRTVNGVVDMGPQEYKPIVVPIDFGTIQEAINNANDGDEIIVLPGFYQENVDFLTKNIRLRSLNPFDPCTVAQTIIDGNDQGSCISILSGQNDSTLVAGLWLQNGYSQFGGGIHVNDSVGPVLMYNYITSNYAWSYGGGVDCRNNAYAEVLNNTIIDNDACTAGGGVHVGPWSSCLIKNNRIENNFTSGEAGGGIYTYDNTTAWIINNIIKDNKALCAWGGGIWQWDSPGGVIEGNIITGNISTASSSGHGDGGRGGGIGIKGSDTLIRNNIICGNKADEGGGIWAQGTGNAKVSNNTIVGNTAEYAGSGIAIAYLATYSITNNIITNNGATGGVYVKPDGSLPSEPNLMNNNVWNNQGGNYIGDINDLTGTGGNISTDPCLLAAGYWVDANDANIIVEPNDPNAAWVFGDYHIPYFSPCRDAGISLHAPLTDFNENPRPYFDGFDIGAYELQFYDLSANGTVDFTDLLLLVNTWLTQGPSIPADLNTDGIVDVRDFVLLGGDWAKQN